jgi:hypothetical protein
MPNLTALPPSPRPPETRTADAGGGGPRAAEPVSTPAPGSLRPAPALPNPAMRLDAALGLVVLEFRGAADGEVRTIPSEREIAAYRSAARGGGAAPAAPPQSSSPPAGRPNGPTPPVAEVPPDADPAATRT